jgi:signal transduction histidine kinase/CheY-like chemotaxis protein
VNLRTICILRCRRGPERIAIYNAQFVHLAAGVHPRLMGQSFAFGFPELLPSINPLFEEGMRSGVAQDVVDAQLMVQRNGYLEEAYFTGNFTPIRGTDGKIVGFYNAVFEFTLQKIHDRRTHMLNLIMTPGMLEVSAVYEHIMKCLEINPLDITMAILHEANTDAQPGRTILRLMGQLGLPEGHALLRDGQDLEELVGNAPTCRESMSGRVVTTVDARFDGVKWLGSGQPTHTVVTVALTTGVRLFGFLTVGMNPCRPFDNTCEQFIKDLTRMSSSVIANAWDAENLRKQQEKLKSELEFSDMKVRHLVQHASVGMAHAKHDGKIIWANDMFFTLAGGVRDSHNTVDSLYDVFLEEDRQKAVHVWGRLLNGENHVSAELRLKRTFIPPVGDPEPAQIQILAFPYKEHGVTVSGMACTTEISRLKWAEAWQARIAEDARAAKKQQEAFIDVVSHEMRNPLSAIVHCADTISTSFSDIEANPYIAKIPDAVLEALRENVASAHIILDCAKHQKRIIDDVLTLGRLESTLLSVTPSPVQPCKLVDSVMALFEAELRTNKIITSVIAEPSIKELNVEYLNLDPSRVTQIFMNLLTNAIKFVKGEKRRHIEVRYGASLASPRSTNGIITPTATFPKDFHWAPKGKDVVDVTDNTEWGTAEVVYLTFSLRDTGIGMDNGDISKIFERFRQANIKTHVTYGGSGLGLYISKELTERMAGEIGVLSHPGEGSRFVFYIKTRRAEISQQDLPAPTKPTLAANDSGLPSKRTTTNKVNTEKLRVLLVEDNLINQRVLQKHLVKSGCDVNVANHGVEALDILGTNATGFDVVLMDMQMPIMDGLTCTSEIRKLEFAGQLKGRIPIIAVTANVRQEQIDNAMNAGADRVVRKPFKAADLVKLMRELVEGKAGANVGAEKGDKGEPHINEQRSSESILVSIPGTLLSMTRTETSGASTRETVSESGLSMQNTLTQTQEGVTRNANERNPSDTNSEAIIDPIEKKPKIDIPQLVIQRHRNSIVLDPGTPILATPTYESALLMEEKELTSMRADLSRQNMLTQTTTPGDSMEWTGSETNSIILDTPLVGSPQNEDSLPTIEKDIGIEL